jgi:hypothetical protein
MFILDVCAGEGDADGVCALCFMVSAISRARPGFCSLILAPRIFFWKLFAFGGGKVKDEAGDGIYFLEVAIGEEFGDDVDG